MTGLTEAFGKAHTEGRIALIGYLPAGFPDPVRFLECARAAYEAGLDVLEIGLPARTAPMDGEVIRTALEELSAAGLSIDDGLALGAQALEQNDLAGVIMAYAQEISAYGSQNLLKACARLGYAGVLPVGMHPADWTGFARIARQNAIAPIAFVSTQSTPDQLNDFARLASGFLYLQSQEGPTGQQGDFGQDLHNRITALRHTTQAAQLPVAVGFGIRSKADISQIAALGADGAIVGTALVEAAARSVDAVHDLISSLSGASLSERSK